MSAAEASPEGWEAFQTTGRWPIPRDDQVCVPVWMNPVIRDWLIANKTDDPVAIVRLIPDGPGFMLVLQAQFEDPEATQ